MFRRTGSGPWKAWDAGIPGNGNFTCAVTPPAGVLSVWSWAPGTCHHSRWLIGKSARARTHNG